MAATYVTVTNATTNILSLVGDNGENRVDILPDAGSNTANINMRDLLGDNLLCTTLSTWITSAYVTITRGSLTLTAADLTAYAQGSDMNRSDYDADDDEIVDAAEAISVANPTAVAFAASPYTVLAADKFLLVDTSGGAVEVDLPAVASSSGRTLVVKDEGGAAATNAITIDPNGAETLDGSATSATITTNYGFMEFFCDGTQWLSKSGSKSQSVWNMTTEVSGGQVVQAVANWAGTTTDVNFAASPYTGLATDEVVLVDVTGGPVAITLPPPVARKTIKFVDITGGAATNNITVSQNAAETIDGATSIVMNANYETLTLISNGTNWFSAQALIRANEAQIALNEAAGIHVAARAVGIADLTASALNQSFDFAAALPASAVVLGAYVDVTEAFTDGVAGTFTVDLGVSGGVTDALINGGDLTTGIAKIAAPLGATPTGWYSATTFAVDVIGTVNVDTATAGALNAKIAYFLVDSAL
jgi:hypothetical protein